jgi:hypothetical protein
MVVERRQSTHGGPNARQPTSVAPLQITLSPTMKTDPKHTWVTVLYTPQPVTDNPAGPTPRKPGARAAHPTPDQALWS